MKIIFFVIIHCLLSGQQSCLGRTPLGNKATRSPCLFELPFHLFPPLPLSALFSSDLNFTCLPWSIILQCYNNFLFSRPRNASHPISAVYVLLLCRGNSVWPEKKAYPDGFFNPAHVWSPNKSVVSTVGEQRKNPSNNRINKSRLRRLCLHGINTQRIACWGLLVRFMSL